MATTSAASAATSSTSTVPGTTATTTAVTSGMSLPPFSAVSGISAATGLSAGTTARGAGSGGIPGSGALSLGSDAIPGIAGVVIGGHASGGTAAASGVGIGGGAVPGAGGYSGYTTGGFNFGGLPQAGLRDPRVKEIKVDGAPKMKGSFDFYEAHLRTFLKRKGCWSVVDGSYRNDPFPLLDFDAKDNAAREAIMAGVPAADGEMICQEETAESMWNRFIDKQTKREYSNFLFERSDFYCHRYTPEKTIESWLQEMEKMRRNLLHFGFHISDEDYAETLLSHVSRTHRDVVRQFSRHYVVRGDSGKRPIPTSDQVMNALRAESALDEKMGLDEQKPVGVAACEKQSKQKQGKGKRKRGHAKSKPTESSSSGKKKKETRTCYGCGEVGHIRPNCPKRNQAKDSDDDSVDGRAGGEDSAESERKRWQSRANKNNDHKRKKTSAVGCFPRGTLVIGSVENKSDGIVEWALDSCSDVHVCNQMDVMARLENDLEHTFQGYDGTTTDNEKVGNVHLRVVNDKQPHQEIPLELKSVLYKQSAPDNLLSLDMLQSSGWEVKLGYRDSQRVAWMKKGRLQLVLPKSRGRYRLRSMVSSVYRVPAMCQRSGDSKALVRWHERFAHLNYATLKQMSGQQKVLGLDDKLHGDVDVPCWSCKMAKMTRMSYKKPITRRVTKPYQKLMSDMCHVKEATYDGYYHFQLVQDEASRYLWGFLIVRKEDATGVVMDHIKWLLAQGHKIELFNSDQGRELLNTTMKLFLRANGIEYTWTNAYSPEENGLVEKMNGVVMSRARCLLKSADMPLLLWGEAFAFAIEVMNISATTALDGDTPYFRRFGDRPDVSSLRTWGCLVFVFTPKVLRRSKLEDTGKPGIFLGFAKHSESYRVLSLVTGKVQEVRSVEFQEEWTVEKSYVEHVLKNRYAQGHFVLPAHLPFVRLPVVGSVEPILKENRKRHRYTGDTDGTIPSYHTDRSSPVGTGASRAEPLMEIEVSAPVATGVQPVLREVDPLRAEGDVREGKRSRVDMPNRCPQSGSLPPMIQETSPSVGDVGVVDGEVDAESDDAFVTEASEDFEEPEENMAVGHGDSVSSMDEIAERIAGSGSEEEEAATDSFRRSRRVRWPNLRYKDYEVELPRSLVIEAVNSVMEPQTVEEALSAPDADQWKAALEKEYKELMRNCTWELVERPEGKKVLTSRWVFVRKRDSRGNVVRHRARITVKGCQQRYGIDYWETYSPVVAQESVKFVLLVALHLGLSCKHIDFVTAFLNGSIDDAEIYMEIPDYFDDGSGRVCKLLRSLYGLKQAPMIWYETLDKYLRSCGFRRCKMDGGVYTRSVGGEMVFVTVYVDDLVIAGSDDNIALVLDELSAKFKLKDLGPVKDLLHMEIEYLPGRALWMSQSGYIDKILKRFGMEDCKPVSTPQALGFVPEPVEEGQPGVNDPRIPYRELVGCLQYLVQGTRPEIANAVRTLGKYMHKYTKEHYVMAKRVLRYLKGTQDYGILWIKPANADLKFTAYADADLGGESDDRRSITGYVLQMNGCTYAYRSHKQAVTYDDTCSTEFVAAAECSVMITWTHNLCQELKLRHRQKTVLFQDNQSTIKVIKALKGNYKVKGVDLKFHKVKDLYERGDFDIQYCPTTDMLADIFTKPLASVQFCKLRQRLNVVPRPVFEMQ